MTGLARIPCRPSPRIPAATRLFFLTGAGTLATKRLFAGWTLVRLGGLKSIAHRWGISHERSLDRAGISAGCRTVCAMGRRCRGGDRPAPGRRHFAALLAGRRRGRLRERRRARPAAESGHRQLSRQGSHGRRTAGRRRQGARRSSPASIASTCTPSIRSTAAAAWSGTKSVPSIFQAGSTGRQSWASAWTSTPPTFRIPRRPTASRWPTATRASASSGSSTASPAARSARPSAAASGTPCVTNVWIPDGMKDMPVDRKGPRERLNARWTRCSPRRSNRPTTSMRSKASCLASARKATSSARTSSIWATPSRNRKLLCLDAGHFHPTETIADKISAVLAVPRRNPAARQPRRPLGQRPRGDSQRRAAGHRRGAGARRFSRPRSHRAGLLRRQHQPRRRLGHRRPRHAQGPAAGAAGARGQAAERGGRGRFHLAPGPAGGDQDPAVRRRLGLLLPQTAASASARPGWTKSNSTSDKRSCEAELDERPNVP